MNHSSRNYGIDLLRIVSMIGVVFLHVLGHGGLLYSYNSPVEFSMVWFFEILSYPAVNCFVLISGYVGYKGDNIFPKIKNLFSLLFTVLFYSITIFFVFKLIGPEPLGMKELIKSFIPTITGRYWFFSAYFGLILLSPVLNLFVHNSNSKHAFAFFVVLFLFSFISIIHDTFSLLAGYSVMWFVLIYLIGAIVKKYDLNKLFSKKIWLIIVLSAFIVTWLSKIVLSFTNISFLQNNSGRLINYVSPTIIVMAVGLLGLFSNITSISSHSKIISFFATSAFSVYLIHDNILIRKYIIANIYTMVSGVNFLFLVLSIIGIVMLIFSCCILIDKIRIFLFKIIKVDKLSKQIEDFIKTKINDIYI